MPPTPLSSMIGSAPEAWEVKLRLPDCRACSLTGHKIGGKAHPGTQ